MSTGVNIAVSVLIGSCLLLGICAGFIRVRRQQRAHQAWLAQRQRGAVNRAVQAFGTRLHDEEVILDPALNPFTPQPLLVVSPDGQEVAVARQYKDPPQGPDDRTGVTSGDDTEKPAAHHGLTAAGAEALASELNVASQQGVPGIASPAAATHTSEPTRSSLFPFGNRLKVKTYWGAYALLDPEPEDLDLSQIRSTDPIEAPANDVILEVRQNMEAARSGDPQAAGAAPTFNEPRPLGWVSSLKAMVNPRRHFPEDGPMPTVPEISSASSRSRGQSGLQRPSGSRVPSRGLVGEPTPGGLAPLPAERHLGGQAPLVAQAASTPRVGMA
ncbi:hypothetical protein WJX74_006853 [Apatococcus lobatus]|uniref:Uncharacterized protein n=1 Tax=Apatococcus lobatus TaxID=904363 RepID=A0AAW1SFV8_9CHLO